MESSEQPKAGHDQDQRARRKVGASNPVNLVNVMAPPRSSWGMITQVVAVLGLASFALPWVGLLLCLAAIAMAIYVLRTRPHLAEWAWIAIATSVLGILLQIVVGFGAVQA